MSQKERDAFVAGALWVNADEYDGEVADIVKAQAARRYPDETPAPAWPAVTHGVWEGVGGKPQPAPPEAARRLPSYLRDVEGRFIECIHCKGSWRKGENERHWYDCTRPVVEDGSAGGGA
jgi:hypothetical protein